MDGLFQFHTINQVVIFLVVLGALIFVHELGHFLVARRLGVGVEKFSLGFGPKLVGFKKKETEYLISLIPLGGYVKLLGEEPSDEVSPPEGSFHTQPIWKRICIVAAGPIFNLFFAVLILAVVYMSGVPMLTTRVGEVAAGSPALRAGILKGDVITAIDGVEIKTWEQLLKTIQTSSGKTLQLRVKRGSQQIMLSVTPSLEKTRNIFGEEVERGRIGIIAAQEVVTKRYHPWTAVILGMEKTWQISALTVIGMGKMFQGKVSADNIAGPIGIAKMVSDQAKVGILPLVSLVALLSISLGILNLLPIPVLDGGHVMFFLFEALRGKPLSLKKKEIAQQVGLALLILLMAFAFYNDIMRMLTR